MDQTTKTCPKCGASVHKDAYFCPYCASSMNRRAAVKPLCPLLHTFLLLAALAVLVGAVWLYFLPHTLEGTGQVTYSDGDGVYVLTLGWINQPNIPTETFNQSIEKDGIGRFPIAFFVKDAGTGEEAGGAFLEKVESVTAGFLPQRHLWNVQRS